MRRLNHDAIIAIFLILASGVLFWSTFSIRTPDYGVLSPAVWPQVIISALGLLSVIYLIQSLNKGKSTEGDNQDVDRVPGVKGWFLHWKNPIFCFALFLAYLLSLPILGSLIGGVCFVFILMSILGENSKKTVLVHGVMSLATVGGMWLIFTYGLDVMLPPGMIFSAF